MALAAPPALVTPAPGDGAPLRDLLGIPYLDDAVQDGQGRWTTFRDPARLLPRPGLNCSGFVVAAARRLLGFGGTPEEAGRDRRGDSGPGAARGRDWDYGWDLVLNLSEGRARRWILSGGPREAPGPGADALRGFSVHEGPAWARVQAQLRPGRVYLATFLRGEGRRLRHHHVAVVLAEGTRVWLYQTLPEGRVHRLDLAGEGLSRLRRMFGPGERLLLLEVEPPPG
ncbi:MAG: hypothetical protein HY823_07520 [Acidobacteria bacterium]|nr:hypothetical protein [Acidobacteriota bacterium]